MKLFRTVIAKEQAHSALCSKCTIFCAHASKKAKTKSHKHIKSATEEIRCKILKADVESVGNVLFTSPFVGIQPTELLQHIDR